MHLIGNNFENMPNPILREALSCMEAQIWSAEEQLAALHVTRAAMQNVLQHRIRTSNGVQLPSPRTPAENTDQLGIDTPLL